MATDLIAKLRLEDRQWNNTINKAKSSVKSFESASKKSFNGAGSGVDLLGKGLGKISGYVAGAVTAMEVFNKAINSNSLLQQDKYNSLMQAGATVTDQFFSAIYSGDWTVFNSGIERAIKQAKEYADTYREVQRMLQVTGIQYEQTDSRKTQLEEAVIEDDTKPLEERKKAQAELDRILLMGVADIREAAQITEQELGKMFTDLIGETKYINTDNAQSLILDIRNKYSDLRREMDAYREIRDTTNQVVNPNTFKYTGWYKINQEATKKYYQNYTADQRVYYDELLRLQDRMNDETFSSFQDLFDRINDLNDKAGTWEKDRTGARDEITDALK